MKHFLTISLCFLALSLSAQETITYPYNPDGDADGLVAVPDLQDILAVYGNPFSPAEIMVGDTALSEWIQILYQALQDQQAVIDAMQGAGGCDLQFPDGLDGDPVIFDGTGGYTVPEGKNLYMYHGYNQTQSGILEINGNKAVSIGTGRHFQHSARGVPLIAKGGDAIGLQGVSSPTYIHALLVDPNITPINFDVHQNSYIVNQGERLYIYHAFSEDGYNSDGSDPIYPILEINGNPCSPIYPSGFKNMMQGLPLIAMPGDVISASNTSAYAQVFGYLADEDYFADCGGGGSTEVEEELGPCQGELTVNYYGYDYQLVEIGEQCWFAENLRTDKFSNGDEIPLGLDFYNFTTPSALPSCEDPLIGWLYNGPCVIDDRNVCPSGYKVPDIYEWSELGATTTGQDLLSHPDLNFIAGSLVYTDGVIDCAPVIYQQFGYYSVKYSSESGVQPYPRIADISFNGMPLSFSNETVGALVMARCIKD
jgi:uncharacterized protein (TIGR02145 family)